MFGTVTFLVVACASAVVVVADAPPYVESLSSYRKTVQTLDDNIMSSGRELPIDDLKRHYLVISNFVSHFAQALSGCVHSPYSDAYLDEVQKQIPYAFRHGSEIIETTINMVNKTDEKIDVLATLIDEICIEVTSEICDRQLDFVIRNDEDKYGESANTLLALGVASDDFNTIADTIHDTASKYSEISFLINGRDLLKPLISNLATVYRHLQDFRC